MLIILEGTLQITVLGPKIKRPIALNDLEVIAAERNTITNSNDLCSTLHYEHEFKTNDLSQQADDYSRL